MYFKANIVINNCSTGSVALSVASLTADPWVASWTPARSHIFIEIDHEIISTVTLLIQEKLLSVTSESMCRKWLTATLSLLRNKSVVRLTDCLDMAVAVDWDIKPQTKQTNRYNHP